MSSEIDLAFIRLFVNEVNIDNYVLLATLTVLVFDIIDTIEMEITHFWCARKSAVAILYFLTRYGAILIPILQLIPNTLNTSIRICRTEYFCNVLNVIIMLCVDYILLLRVRALYSRGRAISIFLFAAFGIETIALVVLGIQVLMIEDVEAVAIAPGLTVCLINDPPAVEYFLSWCIPLAYDALLMALALHKAAVIWKESAGLHGLSLVKVLIRDQAMYFFAVIFVCLVNIVGDVVGVTSLLAAMFTVAGNPCFLSILGARLLFNMKEAGEKGINQGTSCPTMFTVSEIDFAAPSAGAVESSVGEAAEGGEAEIEEVPV